MMSMTPIRSWNAFSAIATKPDRASARNSHEDIPFSIRTARPDSLRLTGLPVRVQAQEDVITQDIP